MNEDELLAKLNEYYGSSFQPEGSIILKGERLFFFSGQNTRLKTEWVGLHIANADLILTIEGAQLIGQSATNNIILVTPEEARNYYLGKDLPGYQGCGPIILKTKDMVLGPGLLEQQKIKNILLESRKAKLG